MHFPTQRKLSKLHPLGSVDDVPLPILVPRFLLENEGKPPGSTSIDADDKEALGVD